MAQRRGHGNSRSRRERKTPRDGNKNTPFDSLWSIRTEIAKYEKQFAPSTPYQKKWREKKMSLALGDRVDMGPAAEGRAAPSRRAQSRPMVGVRLNIPATGGGNCMDPWNDKSSRESEIKWAERTAGNVQVEETIPLRMAPVCTALGRWSFRFILFIFSFSFSFIYLVLVLLFFISIAHSANLVRRSRGCEMKCETFDVSPGKKVSLDQACLLVFGVFVALWYCLWHCGANLPWGEGMQSVIKRVVFPAPNGSSKKSECHENRMEGCGELKD